MLQNLALLTGECRHCGGTLVPTELTCTKCKAVREIDIGEVSNTLAIPCKRCNSDLRISEATCPGCGNRRTKVLVPGEEREPKSSEEATVFGAKVFFGIAAIIGVIGIIAYSLHDSIPDDNQPNIRKVIEGEIQERRCEEYRECVRNCPDPPRGAIINGTCVAFCAEQAGFRVGPLSRDFPCD